MSRMHYFTLLLTLLCLLSSSDSSGIVDDIFDLPHNFHSFLGVESLRLLSEELPKGAREWVENQNLANFIGLRPVESFSINMTVNIIAIGFSGDGYKKINISSEAMTAFWSHLEHHYSHILMAPPQQSVAEEAGREPHHENEFGPAAAESRGAGGGEVAGTDADQGGAGEHTGLVEEEGAGEGDGDVDDVAGEANYRFFEQHGFFSSAIAELPITYNLHYRILRMDPLVTRVLDTLLHTFSRPYSGTTRAIDSSLVAAVLESLSHALGLEYSTTLFILNPNIADQFKYG
eukprot:GCRY01006666.1.p1 GENE.GCRY01006666.1~~GCRY01006666.1.p1  ORF type:complete len:289 (+),score=81.51 GCRY01006666.1:255-1121(+)